MRCSQLAACRGLNRATAMTCCWAEPGNRAHHQWLLRGQDRKQQISTWASAQRRFRPLPVAAGEESDRPKPDLEQVEQIVGCIRTASVVLVFPAGRPLTTQPS